MTAGHTQRRWARGLRRRLILAIAPLTLVTVALVAIVVGRVSRLVASEVLTSQAARLVQLTLHETTEPEVDLRGLLEEVIVDRRRDAVLLVEDGAVSLAVGVLDVPEVELVAEAHELLAGRQAAADVRGFGPIHARLLAVASTPDGRMLILERRVHGVWTPFTAAVVGLSGLVVVVGIGLAVLLGWRLQRPIVDRLDTLESALLGYAAGDTGRRLGGGADGDEFDRVDQAFDAMADRIAVLERERATRLAAERELLADLAHDVNTPITVLRGSAEALLERAGRMSSEDRARIATEMLGQTLYVQAIVDDLLTLASSRQAKLEVVPVDFELDPLLDAVVDGFAPLAERRGITLLGDAGGLCLHADPVRLRQVVTNLVRNAMLHAAGATVVEIGASAVEDGVVLWVEDDGPGVDAAEAEGLFARHRRGSRSVTDGWGLGLAIVRTLVEAHGGRVGYARSPSGGARFELWLPSACHRDADSRECGDGDGAVGRG